MPRNDSLICCLDKLKRQIAEGSAPRGFVIA